MLANDFGVEPASSEASTPRKISSPSWMAQYGRRRTTAVGEHTTGVLGRLETWRGFC